MIIEDIHGNIITNPNLEKGRLEKAQRDGDTIYIYFPFNEDDQQAYEVNNQAAITQDKCSCVIYENTKDTIKYSDTDPFCYSYARRVKRDELTINECPQELRERIEEIVSPEPSAECSIFQTATHCRFERLEESYTCGTPFDFDVYADNGYRLPSYEELGANVNIVAEDTEGEEIDNFFQDHCTWKEQGEYAIVYVDIPNNCVKITININCVEE